MSLWFLALVGCNQYDMFRTAGYLRADYPRGADVLFVIDNSESMAEEALGLAASAGTFAQRVAELEASFGEEGLADATDRYIAEVSDRGTFVDFQLAITTTDAISQGGALSGEGAFFRKGDPDLARSFETALLCEATCFPKRDAVPSLPGATCDTFPEGAVSAEYLDCLCGADAWVGNCGRDDEEPLEAVLLAMCRSLEDPPEVCFEQPDRFGAADLLTNDGLLRDGNTFIPVLITDEGDGSPRDLDYVPVPTQYELAYRQFGIPMSWGVVAPTVAEDRSVKCPGVATSWGILRFDYLVETSGGMRADLYDPSCQAADFAQILTQVGDLVAGRAATFPLHGPADPATIRVFVEGEEVERGTMSVDVYGFPHFGDGFSYDANDWTVILHGAAIPPVSAEVEIVYLPAAE